MTVSLKIGDSSRIYKEEEQKDGYYKNLICCISEKQYKEYGRSLTEKDRDLVTFLSLNKFKEKPTIVVGTFPEFTPYMVYLLAHELTRLYFIWEMVNNGIPITIESNGQKTDNKFPFTPSEDFHSGQEKQFNVLSVDKNGFLKDGNKKVTIDPTWVELPAQFGGKRSNVKETFYIKKCVCGDELLTRVVTTESNHMVVECLKRGFAWMEKPKDISKFKKQFC